MRLDRFDLNLLVALDALLTEKHVTRAADKVFVSQPAMSASLARLRDYFGDQLLERVGTSLELTPRAVDLAVEVRDLLFRIRTTLQNAPSFTPTVDHRDFRLLMTDYVASVLMPVVTRRLLAEAPHVRCQVEHLTRMSLRDVSQGAADFCITVLDREQFEQTGDTVDLSSATLFGDAFVLVMDGSGDPPAEVPLAEFLRLPYVEVRFTHAVFSVIESAIRRQQLPLATAAIMPSFTAAAYLIPGTRMTTILPRRLAGMLAPALGLVLRDSPIELPPLSEALVWHARTNADPAHRWFRDFLHRAAADLGD